MINRFRPFDGFYGMRKNIVDSRLRTLAQHKNISLVKDCAKKLNLKLRRFQANGILELYFDVLRGNKNICYLSKAWEDPGFRIGDIIMLDKNIPNFKQQFYEIFNICSKNFVSMGICKPRKNRINILELDLAIGIYKDGFNEKVLREAIETFKYVVEKIKRC